MKFNEYTYTSQQLNERISQIEQAFNTQKIDRSLLCNVLSLLDLTTLNGTDNAEVVSKLCTKATSFAKSHHDCGNVAAVCVYPPFVNQAKKLLAHSGVAVASVAGAFPSGQSPIAVKVAEVAYCVEQGADEIDMVISRGTFLEGNFEEVSSEITAIKTACKQAHLKVILETGELQSVANIRKASELAILAGGDFIKTSTGKINPSATPEAMLVMCDTIKEYFEATGKKIGIKPAGGIADTKTALLYYAIVQAILGKDWLTPGLFRIGASRLADDLLTHIESL
jgi:deoxyribose-phosphate aldolase